MPNHTIIPVLPQWAERAYIDRERYRRMYRESVEQPDRFWTEQAEAFAWRGKWNRIKNTSFTVPPSMGEGVLIRWFEGATLNITENCLDRHLPARADQTAFIWEGDDPGESKRVTYKELH